MIASANKKHYSIWFYLPAFAGCLIALAFGWTAAAHTAEMVFTGTIRQSQTVENDVFLSGDNPVLEGQVDGNVFVFGKDVTINGDVNGSIFAIADTINLSGKVTGSVYAAAISLEQQSSSQIDRNLNMVGVGIMTEEDAQVGRDLQIYTVSANLKGQVGRDTRAEVGLPRLLNILVGGVRELISGVSAASPQGVTDRTLAIASLSNVTLDGGSPFLFELANQPVAQDQPAQPAVQVLKWLLNVLKSLAIFFILGLLMMWLLPNRFVNAATMARTKPWATTGVGAVVIINGFLLPLLLIALVGALFFGLLYLNLQTIAWLVLGIGVGGLIAIFSVFLLIAVYASKAVIAHLVGTMITTRLSPRLARYTWLPLLVGLFLYVLLASVPYLGFALSLIITLMGLGAIWMTRGKAAAVPLAVPSSEESPKPEPLDAEPASE